MSTQVFKKRQKSCKECPQIPNILMTFCVITFQVQKMTLFYMTDSKYNCSVSERPSLTKILCAITKTHCSVLPMALRPLK